MPIWTKKGFNPFYALLVVLGIVFALTVCAYVVMAVQMATVEGVSGSAPGGLIDFMNEHGVSVMVGELILLAVVTFAAMATDSYWHRRESKADPGSHQEPPHEPQR